MPYLRMEGERRVACMGRLARPAKVRKNKRGLAGCSIVGKMEAWMNLCDSLGQQPSENKQKSRAVFRALLREAWTDRASDLASVMKDGSCRNPFMSGIQTTA
jgi:hypothetical protein